jgi:hypothetical protein
MLFSTAKNECQQQFLRPENPSTPWWVWIRVSAKHLIDAKPFALRPMHRRRG